MRRAPGADAMDEVIHSERLAGRAKRRHRMALDTLPDGAMIALPSESGDEAFAVRGDRLLRWTPSGYRGVIVRPRRVDADALTPPSILGVLTAGFEPRWHRSAARAA